MIKFTSTCMNWASKALQDAFEAMRCKIANMEKSNTLTYTISLDMKEMHSKNYMCVCVCVSIIVVRNRQHYIQVDLEHFSNNTYKEMEPIKSQ